MVGSCSVAKLLISPMSSNEGLIRFTRKTHGARVLPDGFMKSIKKERTRKEHTFEQSCFQRPSNFQFQLVASSRYRRRRGESKWAVENRSTVARDGPDGNSDETRKGWTSYRRNDARWKMGMENRIDWGSRNQSFLSFLLRLFRLFRSVSSILTMGRLISTV